VNIGTTDFSAFLTISYYSVLLAAQMNFIKKLLSGKRSWRSSEDQTSVNQMNKVTEELLSMAAVKRQKKQEVSEREYTYQSKVVLQNFV